MHTILVVEDETLVRLVAVEMLVEAGYRVLEARDADEALEILASRDDCRAMITDVKMPGSMDGIELAFRIAERWPSLRIGVVSGHALPGQGEIPPGSTFLPKPYRPEDFLRLAASLIGPRAAETPPEKGAHRTTAM